CGATASLSMITPPPASAPFRPEVARRACPWLGSQALQALQQAKFRKIRSVVPTVPCEKPISLHCGMGADEKVTYQMLPATECSPTMLTGELLHLTAHRAEKPYPTLAGVGSPGSPSTSEGCWLGWDQAHVGVGQKPFQLL